MEEYIAGKHAVLEAVRSGRAIHKIWIAEQAQRSSVQPIIAEAKQRGILVQYADKRKLDQAAGKVQHQGVVAQAAAYEYADVEDILQSAAEAGQAPLIFIRTWLYCCSMKSKIRIISAQFCVQQLAQVCMESSFRSGGRLD